MLTHSRSLFTMVLIDELGSVFHFPVWWYTYGFLDLLKWVKHGLIYRWKKYALGLWIRHIFVPMYGEYTIVGRLMSFFMRVVVIIGRFIALFFEVWAYLVLMAGWLLAPLVCIGMLIRLAFDGLLTLV